MSLLDSPKHNNLSNKTFINNDLHNEFLLSNKQFNEKTVIDDSNANSILYINIILFSLTFGFVIIFIFASEDIYTRKFDYLEGDRNVSLYFSLYKLDVEEINYKNGPDNITNTKASCFYNQFKSLNETELNCNNISLYKVEENINSNLFEGFYFAGIVVNCI